MNKRWRIDEQVFGEIRNLVDRNVSSVPSNSVSICYDMLALWRAVDRETVISVGRPLIAQIEEQIRKNRGVSAAAKIKRSHRSI